MRAAQKLEQFKALGPNQKCFVCGNLIGNHCLKNYLQCQSVLEGNLRLEKHRAAKEAKHDNQLK